MARLLRRLQWCASVARTAAVSVSDRQRVALLLLHHPSPHLSVWSSSRVVCSRALSSRAQQPPAGSGRHSNGGRRSFPRTSAVPRTREAAASEEGVNEREEDAHNATMLADAEAAAAGAAATPEDDGEPVGPDSEDDATPADMQSLMQQMLCVVDPDMVLLDPATLAAKEYTPIAPGVAWARLRDVAVVLPLPRDWSISRGEGRMLGVPFTTYVACWNDRPEAHNLGLTVTQYRGAFSSQLLASAHRSPREVVRFFSEMHIVKRSPPGLVTAETFSGHDGGGHSSNSSGSGRGASSGGDGAATRWSGDPPSPSSPQPPSGFGSPMVTHSDPLRKPDILASWHRSVRRGDIMELWGGGEAVVHVPVAAPARQVLAQLRGAMGGSGSSGSGRQQQRPPGAPTNTAEPAATASGAQPPPPPLLTQPAVVRDDDPIEVYGIEYGLRYEPGSEGRAAGGDHASLDLAPSPWGMRYCLTLIADPAADSVHEITFACPADAWDAIWSHEATSVLAVLPRAVAASEGPVDSSASNGGGGDRLRRQERRRQLANPLPAPLAPQLPAPSASISTGRSAAGDGVALAGTVGLLHLTASELMDSVTVTGIVDWSGAPAAPQHEFRGYDTSAPFAAVAR